MTQHSLFNDRKPTAEFSLCGRYRYLLRWPTAVLNDLICLWVLANPSVATEEKLDPTLTRCVDFSQRWGFGWTWVANARAWRETDPTKIPVGQIAIGPHNDDWVLASADSADLIVCGWGKLGGDRGTHIARMLMAEGHELNCVKRNSDNTPTHPLYLSKTLQPQPWGLHL